MIFKDDCSTKACRYCLHHGKCLMEKAMIKEVQALKELVKYELAVLEQHKDKDTDGDH